jgi:hypothetical protein
MTAHVDEFPPEPDDGEIVHWMEPRSFSFGLGEVSAATLTAFALGALVAVGTMGLIHQLSSDAESGPARAKR